MELVAHEYNRVSVGKSAHAPHKVYPLSRAPGWLKAFTARVDTMIIYYYNGDIADSISSQTDEEGVVPLWERASMCACGDFK